MSIHNAKSAFYKFNQRDLSLNDYRERFNNVVEIATSYDNKLYDDKLLNHLCEKEHDTTWATLQEEPEENENLIEELEAEAHDITVATGFLACCDRRRYGKVLDDLENDCIKGDFNYPRDMPAAYKMLSEYNTGIRGNSNASQTTGLAFAQRTMKCYGCGKLDFTKRTCPDCSKTYQPKAFDKGKGGYNNHNRQDKSDKKVSFAQVKSK